MVLCSRVGSRPSPFGASSTKERSARRIFLKLSRRFRPSGAIATADGDLSGNIRLDSDAQHDHAGDLRALPGYSARLASAGPLKSVDDINAAELVQFFGGALDLERCEGCGQPIATRSLVVIVRRPPP
jgi:hypothetical protein